MKREQNKHEKREAILKAAHTEFEGHRFDEVKLDDIAARAGVGKGTLYLYFKGKEDLFLHLAVDGMDEMAERVQEVTASDCPYEECFFTLGAELARFFKHRIGLIRLMHQAGSKKVLEEFLKHRVRMKKAVYAFLKRGVDEGVLRDDFPAETLQVALVGPLLLRGRFMEDGEAMSPDALLQIIWDGIKENR